jgi:hypothetical protein
MKKKNPKKHKLFEKKKMVDKSKDNIIKLPIIPEPDPSTRTIFIIPEGSSDTLFMRGYSTNLKFLCGNCGAILMEGIEKNQVRNIVLKCNKCKMFNES